MSSNGFAAPFKQLAPTYESSSKTHLTPVWGSSMGASPDSIPSRLGRGEAADVVIMARSELDSLAKKGLVVEGSQTDLAHSRIGMAVRAGAPVPNISTVAAFKSVLLGAKSIAYSSSSSGVYVSTELYQRLGLNEQLAPKSKKIVTEPVGNVIARGEAEIGFQQLSELQAVQGITIVGPIPAELQKMTIFAVGIVASSHDQKAAQDFIHFLTSPAACPVIAQNSLEPVACLPGQK
jgi:molybdate transport system substrate-binding protein